MRSISAASLAKLQQRQGGEPTLLLQIYWSDTEYVTYSDRAFPAFGLVGKLLSVNNIDSVINVNTGSNSSTCSVTIDDTDGSIKDILNSVDIQKKRAVLYQWFSDLPITDAFVMLDGQINSPITWKEGDRTVSFDVLSKIEDVEIGFSADDGEFTNVPVELVGKGWPLVFGTCINVPALMLDRIPHGATLQATGIVDQSLQQQIDNVDCQTGRQTLVANCLSRVGAELQFDGLLNGGGREIYDKGLQFQQRAEDIRNQIANHLRTDKNRLKRIKTNQEGNYDLTVITVLNGFKFIQNTPVGVRIGSAHYYGVFLGDEFHVISRRGPDDTQSSASSTTPPSDQGSETINITLQNLDFVDFLVYGDIRDEDFITPTDADKKEDPCGPLHLQIVDLDPKCTDLGKKIYKQQLKVNEGKFFFNQAGSPVVPDADYPIRYIVNIIPGTVVLAVASKKTVGGVKILTTVPPSLYTVTEQVFGSVTATIITLSQPLSSIQNDDWEDELYITLQSGIGPNTADIMAYMITRWAPGYGIDPVSFAAVRARLEPFPSHFVYEGRDNLLDALKKIAYQCRCMIFLSNGIFYFRYLPAAETPGDEFTEDDVENKSLELTFTRTEEIITQYTATWKVDHALPPNKIILQNNVPKYGLRKEEQNIFIYNTEELVEKTAVYWLIRKSNTYKKLKFKTFIHKLRTEAMDTVTLNFANNYVANGPVQAVVEKALFNPNDWTIEIEVWIPVRAGEMAEYNLAIPADNDLAVFPEIDEQAGSQSPNKEAHGDLASPVGPTINVTRTNRKRSKQQPKDAGFTQPTLGTTVSNFGPPGGSSQQTQPQQTPPPAYATRYNQYRELDRPKLGFSGGGVPGKVVAKVENTAEGAIYTVSTYVDGLDKDPVEVKAIQLQIDPSDELNEGTWAVVSRQTYVTPATTAGQAPVISFKYYMQVAVWISDPVS